MNEEHTPLVPAALPKGQSDRFSSASKTELEAVASKAQYGGSGRLILYPAGLCPVKLSSSDQETVSEWIESVVEAGHSKNLHYAPSALRYFAREYFDLFSPAYQQVCDNIQLSFDLPSLEHEPTRLQLVKEHLIPPPEEPAVSPQKQRKAREQLADLIEEVEKPPIKKSIFKTVIKKIKQKVRDEE